jgi:dephospho-CoA kinase
MKVVGLTGSIAMGKSETAKMFAALGVPVFDSDAIVHRLYALGGAAVAPVGRAFPGAVRDGAIDRGALSAALARDETLLPRLEAIVHPLVRAEQERFLAACRSDGHKLALLDIPLLFETGLEKDLDAVVVVSAPADIQRARALARPGMTDVKLAAILGRQMPDAEKRRRADFIVDSGQGLDHAFAQVRRIVQSLREEPGEDARNNT